MSPDARPALEAWDTLHDWSAPSQHWATTNVRENLPGVPTPLTWSVWRRASELAVRHTGYAIGAFPSTERMLPTDARNYYNRIFYGRYALQVEYLTTLGDRMPGTSGQDVAASLLGRVPEDIEYRPTRRRYPVIAWRLPLTFVTVPRQVRDQVQRTEAWYHTRLARVPGLDLTDALASFSTAADEFVEVVTLQTTAVVGVIQPLYDALRRVVEWVGVGDVGTLSGSGGAEMIGLVGDLWKASRGQLQIDEVLRAHGFHGPLEGELSARVWREDESALRRRLKEYAARDDSTNPLLLEETQRRRRAAMTREVLAAVPLPIRPAVRLLLHLAARHIPLRGVAKRSMLQALDVARASARRAGVCLAATGALDDPEDVFYLTRDELTGEWPADARDLVARRRQRRAEYEQLDLPSSWTGIPDPLAPEADLATDDATEDPQVVTGVGVSPGVVEGRARVILDPDFADIEPDEILVAPTTNPSWSSIMFVSAGLVVDIGGALSHAAVVARELELPCVVNTRTGSRVIKTGDRIRLDGSRGTVEILPPVERPAG